MSALQTRALSAASRAPLDEREGGEESGERAAHKKPKPAEICPRAAPGGSPEEGAESLEEIRAELERRTWETQQLQAEVERTTQLTLERMGCSLGAGPRRTRPPWAEGPSREVTPAAACSTQPSALPLARRPPEDDERPLGRDATDTMLEQYSLQVSALQRQLSETHELHEQQKVLLRSAIMRLQTQLHEGQLERDAMADRSAAESCRQAHQLEELLSQREAERHRLLETEAQVGALQSKSEALEQTLQEAGAVLSAYEKRRCVAAGAPPGPRDVSQPSLGVAMEMALRDLEMENGGLRTKLQRLERQLEAERRAKERAERESVELTDRVERLSSGHHQEAAVLREKLRSSEATVSNLQAQLQLVRKQAEARASAVQRQLGDLERSLSALNGPMLEAQHTHLRQGLQEALANAEALRAEGEELRKKLESKECEVEGLEVERRQLGDELQEHKLQVQHLKLSLEHQESRTRGLEQQLTEKTHELEVQRTRLAHLADEQAALRQSLGAQWAELEGANLRLRAQLDQAKSTLRTLEGADGHGLKVALYMQKEITAKREQIDVLQGRVQLLQESLDKVSQEQEAQGAELQATRQRLSSVSTERRRLSTELYALRSLEKRLRDKTDALQAALDKMSERLAECEGRAQQREQEIFRLKIHHTLHLRNPDIDLGSLVQELCGINEKDRSEREPPPERPCPLGQHTGCRKRSGSFTCTPGPSGPSFSCVRELHLGRRSPVSSLLMSSPVSTSDINHVPHSSSGWRDGDAQSAPGQSGRCAGGGAGAQ